VLLCRSRQRLAFAHDVDGQNLGAACAAFGVVNSAGRDLVALGRLQRLGPLTVDHQHKLAFQKVAGFRTRMRYRAARLGESLLLTGRNTSLTIA
jgi:hypothetical protein